MITTDLSLELVDDQEARKHRPEIKYHKLPVLQGHRLGLRFGVELGFDPASDDAAHQHRPPPGPPAPARVRSAAPREGPDTLHLPPRRPHGAARHPGIVDDPPRRRRSGTASSRCRRRRIARRQTGRPGHGPPRGAPRTGPPSAPGCGPGTASRSRPGTPRRACRRRRTSSS